jgi:hypothetical protein
VEGTRNGLGRAMLLPYNIYTNVTRLFITMPRNKNKQTISKKAKQGPQKTKVKVVTGKGAYSIKDMASMAKNAVKSALKNKDTRSMIINGAGSLSDRLLPGSKNTAKGLAQFLLNKVSGSGAYSVGGNPASNSLFKQTSTGEMASGNALSIPKMHTAGNSIRVSHREYVMDILAPENGQEFNPMVFTVNPGDSTIFPWLSNLAQLFEQYKFHGLVFEFVSTTSPYNQTPAMGYVMFAAQYNVLQAPFQSPIELENSTDSIMARPDHCLMYGVECATQSYNYYYVRNNRNVVVDPATYDFVDITLATKGLPSSYTPGSVLGQLWISFDIELVQPIYELPAGGSCLLAGNPLNNAIGNFLGPFEFGIGQGRSSINFNGRFTPVALNGSGKPLFSTRSIIDTSGIRQTILIVELANMEAGNGVMVQLTVTGKTTAPTGSSPPGVSMTSGTTPSYGTAVIIQTTPSFQLTTSVNCALANYDPYSISLPQNLNSQYTSVRSTAASPTTVSVQMLSPGTNMVSYTYTWYVVVSGSNPGFEIQPSLAYNVNNIIQIGGTATNQYTTQLNMTLIKNTTAAGTPTFVPYTVPPGVTPTSVRQNFSNSMLMNRSFTQKYQADAMDHEDERAMLRILATRHGLVLSDHKNMGADIEKDMRESVPPTVVRNANQDSDDEDYQAPQPPSLQRVKSLSFSSRF